MNSKINAPFTAQQVVELNRYQKDGATHPLTCGRRRTDAEHLDGEGVLEAYTGGMRCPYCDYTQTYAFAFMLERSRRPYGRHGHV